MGLAAVIGAAAFWQFSQNKVEKQTHSVSVASVASKTSQVKIELKELREQRKKDNIQDFVKTKAEIEDE